MDDRPEGGTAHDTAHLSRAMYVWLIVTSLVLGPIVVMVVARWGNVHDRRAIVAGSLILGYPVGVAILVIRAAIAARMEPHLRPLRLRIAQALRSRPRDPRIPAARALRRASTSPRLTK